MCANRAQIHEYCPPYNLQFNYVPISVKPQLPTATADYDRKNLGHQNPHWDSQDPRQKHIVSWGSEPLFLMQLDVRIQRGS